MAEFADALKILSSGMRSQGQRLRHISENVANADTPGYRRKVIDFVEMVQDGRRPGMVEPGDVRLDRTEARRIHDPSHPMAGTDGFYDGSNVEIVTELADAREAQRSYEANLKMFEQVRRMSANLMDILKR